MLSETPARCATSAIVATTDPPSSRATPRSAHDNSFITAAKALAQALSRSYGLWRRHRGLPVRDRRSSHEAHHSEAPARRRSRLRRIRHAAGHHRVQLFRTERRQRRRRVRVRGQDRADHQDRLQPVLRQDARGRAGGGRRERRRADRPRRRVRRRQRRPGGRDREPGQPGRAGHPHHAELVVRHPCGHQERARPGRHRDRARHRDRPGGRGGRDLRDRQLRRRAWRRAPG